MGKAIFLMLLLLVVSSNAMASDDIIESRLKGVETDIDIFRSISNHSADCEVHAHRKVGLKCGTL